MKIEVYLLSTSQAIIHEGVSNAYVKDWLYCVYIGNTGLVYKYPSNNIFRIVETY